MDFSLGIPKESTTMVVIPSVIKTGKDVKEVFEKLEVYYLANKSENLYLTLLADPTSGGMEKEQEDKEVIDTGLYEVDRLNKKYGKTKENAIFNFIYRKRKWQNQEKCYMGWERKRGILTELNNFLQDKKLKNTFIVNTLEKKDLKIKYIITLDSDTELILNSGLELIGTMAHPLNTHIIEDR